jgi:hypothetical protein
VAGQVTLIYTTRNTDMRSAITLLLLTATMNIAYAEDTSPGDDVQAYCKEQADMAGIEDATELSEYIQDCIDSYSTPAGE